jgi:hypothetical protein
MLIKWCLRYKLAYMYQYMCMYVHVCTCMCMYVHVCTCMYMYVHVCTCMYMYVHVCTCMYMYVHVCTWMSMYVHVCPCMSMYAHVCTCMHMYVHECTCICMCVGWFRRKIVNISYDAVLWSVVGRHFENLYTNNPNLYHIIQTLLKIKSYHRLSCYIGLPDGTFECPKFPFWYTLEGIT